MNWGAPGRGKRPRGKREHGDFWKPRENGWSLERLSKESEGQAKKLEI